jgi:hypothetical protein
MGAIPATVRDDSRFMESPPSLDTTNFRRVLPWLHLFRAFWIAVDLRKLVLAGTALLLVSGGSWCWDQLFLTSVMTEEQLLARDATRWPWQQSLGYDLRNPDNPLGEVNSGLRDPWNTLTRIGRNWQIALRPVADVADPVVDLMQGRGVTWMHRADATARLLWGLMVWAVFGGAIGRMAALQFSRDQQVRLGSGLRFSCRNFFNYLYAPLLPLLGMAVLWVFCLVIGVLGRIPGGGPTIVGVTWGLGLACGFLMTVILIGVTAGWPIMFATVNVEATDGFDALSRGFHYVMERPLHYFSYAVFSVAFGAFSIFFVWLAAHLIVHLTTLAVASGMGLEPATQLLVGGPPLTTSPSLASPTAGDATIGRTMVVAWNRGVAVLVLGFVYSFFWTSTTIIYLLLRRSADGKELDEVQLVPEPRRDPLATYAPRTEPVAGLTAPEVTTKEPAARIDLAP